MTEEQAGELSPVLPYQKEYEEFIAQYQSGNPMAAEEIGKIIAKLAQYYGQANTLYGMAKIKYNEIASTIVQTEDNGKPISVSKADLLIRATKESQELVKREVDLKNIEMQINALKSLQKGVLNEYSHMSNI